VRLEVRVEPGDRAIDGEVVLQVDGVEVGRVTEAGRTRSFACPDGRMLSVAHAGTTLRTRLDPHDDMFGVALMRSRRGDRLVHTGIVPGSSIDALLARRRKMARSVAISTAVAVLAIGVVLVALLG
jgi:hypothetical protein